MRPEKNKIQQMLDHSIFLCEAYFIKYLSPKSPPGEYSNYFYKNRGIVEEKKKKNIKYQYLETSSQNFTDFIVSNLKS